jgi:hypothetical protein
VFNSCVAVHNAVSAASLPTLNKPSKPYKDVEVCVAIYLSENPTNNTSEPLQNHFRITRNLFAEDAVATMPKDGRCTRTREGTIFKDRFAGGFRASVPPRNPITTHQCLLSTFALEMCISWFLRVRDDELSVD